MKKVMAVIVAVTLFLSMLSVPVFATETEVLISGRKTATQAAFTVKKLM